MIAITLAGWSVPSLTGSSHAGTRAVARRKSFGPYSRSILRLRIIAAYFTFMRACMCVYCVPSSSCSIFETKFCGQFAKSRRSLSGAEGLLHGDIQSGHGPLII